MKKVSLLLVLALLASSAFALVTGEVFMRIGAGGTELAKGGDLPGDLTTGFRVNFAGFGLEYRFLPTATIGGVATHSPGYINITGISAGPLTLGAGLLLRLGYDNPAIEYVTNPPATNITGRADFAYSIRVLPRIALNIGTMNVTTSDQTDIVWEEAVTKTYGANFASTNRTDHRNIVLRLGANMRGLWNGEMGGFYRLGMTENSLTVAGSTTNWTQGMNHEVNSWVDYTMPLGPDFDFFVKGWFRWLSHANTTKNFLPTTNETVARGSRAYFGPEARVQYKIAGGQVRLNLGAGIAWMIWQDSFNDTLMVGNVGTNITATNETRSWMNLYGVKRDDDRALLEFGGSTRFGNWEFGMTGRLRFAIELMDETFDPVTGTREVTILDATTYWGSEPLFTPILKDVYAQFSQNMFRARFNLSGLGTGAGAWFSSVELSYRF